MNIICFFIGHDDCYWTFGVNAETYVSQYRRDCNRCHRIEWQIDLSDWTPVSPTPEKLEEIRKSTELYMERQKALYQKLGAYK